VFRRTCMSTLSVHVQDYTERSRRQLQHWCGWCTLPLQGQARCQQAWVLSICDLHGSHTVQGPPKTAKQWFKPLPNCLCRCTRCANLILCLRFLSSQERATQAADSFSQIQAGEHTKSSKLASSGCYNSEHSLAAVACCCPLASCASVQTMPSQRCMCACAAGLCLLGLHHTQTRSQMQLRR